MKRRSAGIKQDSGFDGSFSPLDAKIKAERPVRFTPLRCVLGSVTLSFLCVAIVLTFSVITQESSGGGDGEERVHIESETIVFPDLNCERFVLGGDTISVHYTGWLLKTGQKFDSSVGRRPFSFKIGAGKVIEGWEQGVVGMCVGEKRKITIPPELGYGNRFMKKIPPGSTLVFEIELVAIESKQRPSYLR